MPVFDIGGRWLFTGRGNVPANGSQQLVWDVVDPVTGKVVAERQVSRPFGANNTFGYDPTGMSLVELWSQCVLSECHIASITTPGGQMFATGRICQLDKMMPRGTRARRYSW